MESKILFKKFEHQIVQNAEGIQIETRPWSLVLLGGGIGVIGLIISYLSSIASTEVLLILIRGFSYLIGILSAVFVLIGLVSFLPKFKVYMKIDLNSKKVFTRKKSFAFSDVRSLQISPLGHSFLILQFAMVTDPSPIGILTLPVSKKDLLENLKKEFEQIFTAQPAGVGNSAELSKNSNTPENIQLQSEQLRKLTFIFTELLGLTCAVVFYFVFAGLSIKSRYSEGVEIPFWSIGILIMIVGVFNFLKKKK